MQFSHLLDAILAFLPLGIVLGFVCKETQIRVSKIQVMVIGVLLFFGYEHVNPYQLVVQQIHQHDNVDSNEHPCCIPQVASIVSSFFADVNICWEREQRTFKRTALQHDTYYQPNSRSPPRAS